MWLDQGSAGPMHSSYNTTAMLGLLKRVKRCSNPPAQKHVATHRHRSKPRCARHCHTKHLNIEALSHRATVAWAAATSP